MRWLMKDSKPIAAHYNRLVVADGSEEYCMEAGRVPRGHVPVLVGSGRSMKRFVVPVRVFRNPSIASMLDMAAQELGYCHQGVLRIPCVDADHFRRAVDVASNRYDT